MRDVTERLLCCLFLPRLNPGEKKNPREPERFATFPRVLSSVADPGCLSRIPDPDFYPSRIPDLGSRIQKQQQKRGVKKNLLSKLKIILVLKCRRKKFGPVFKEF